MGESIMAQLRKARAGKRPPEPKSSFDAAQLREAVEEDQGLSASQRTSLLADLENPTLLGELKSGALGAILGNLLARRLKLSGNTKLLLSIAGFGIGKIIYDYRHTESNNSTRYDKKQNLYELK